MAPDRWIPFEWPATWRDPSLFALLDGSPVNCLLLPPDAPSSIREAAAGKGLDCPEKIPWSLIKEINWKSKEPLLAIKDAFWPELSRKTGGAAADTSEAGPTGAPWLDANGWLIQLARARAPERTLWIRSDPPDNPDRLSASNYQLAAAEAWTYGARRPLWLAPAHAAQVAAGNEQALQTWRQLQKTVAWTEQRLKWQTWKPFARLVALSDYSGPNEYTASETLILAARRNLAFLPCETGKFAPATLRGMRAVLYIDDQELPATATAALEQFLRAGGLVLSLKKPAAAFKGRGPIDEPHPRFDVFRYGKGRLAVAKGDYDDPYLLAQDAHLLMSRRYDSVRLFNAGSIQWFHTASPDGLRWLVHLVNYSRWGAAHQVTLQSWQAIRSARLHSPETAEPQALEVHRETGHQEFYLPRFAVHASVELELG